MENSQSMGLSLGVFNSDLSTLNLINYSSSFPIPAFIPAEVSVQIILNFLYLPDFPNLGVVISPCGLTSLMDLRRVVNFQFVQFFYLLSGWNSDFQAFYMQRQKHSLTLFSLSLSSTGD
jgi:hypothetical protein